MLDVIKEWWAIGIAALGVFIGFKSGQERNKWRIDSLETQMAQIKHDQQKQEDKFGAELRKMSETRSADAVTLGVIKTTLEQLRNMTAEIDRKLEHKVDK